MDMVKIESFVSLCRYGSFTKAAEQLFVSQSAFSKRIAALEADYGPLIQRDEAGFVLTATGRELLERSEKILLLQDETEKYLKEMRQGTRSRLKIGYRADADSILKLAAYAIDVLCRTHPEVKLSFEPISTDSNYLDLIRRNIFDCILAVRQELDGSAVMYRTFSITKWCVVASKTHPCARQAAMSMDDLLKEDVVLYTRNKLHAVHTLAKDLISHGYDPQRILYTDDKFGAMLYVVTGRYVTISAMNSGEVHEPFHDLVTLIPLEGYEQRGGDKVAAYDNSNPTACLFVDILVDQSREETFRDRTTY